MTISSTARTAGPFTGNGTASAFPFAFKVFAAGDVDVFRTLTSTGVVTTLVLNSDYTVALNANQDSSPGGTVTLTGGNLATGTTLLVSSGVDNTQQVDLTNQGGFYPDVINGALDRATVQVQQVQQQANRSLRFPDTEISVGAVLPKASDRANQYLAFGSDGSVGIGGAVPTQVYYGSKTSDPATRNDGTARVSGDLYFNSASNAMKVFNGSSWVAFTSAVTDGNKGDVTISGGGATYTIVNDAVTYAKIQNVSATDRLLGRDTAGAGDIEELTVGGGIEFTGSGGIRTAAFTGNVTKSAGGTALTIANGAVAPAMLTTGGPSWDASGNVTVSGTAAVTGTSTFTGAPSYAADPGSANVLARKSYVDSLYRIGSTKIVKVDGANTTVGYETGGTTFTITSSKFRAPSGETWEGTRMDGTVEAARTVTSSADNGPSTAANAVYVFVRTA